MRVIDKRNYEIYSLDYMLRREKTLLLEQSQAELWHNLFWLYDFLEETCIYHKDFLDNPKVLMKEFGEI